MVCFVVQKNPNTFWCGLPPCCRLTSYWSAMFGTHIIIVHILSGATQPFETLISHLYTLFPHSFLFRATALPGNTTQCPWPGSPATVSALPSPAAVTIRTLPTVTRRLRSAMCLRAVPPRSACSKLLLRIFTKLFVPGLIKLVMQTLFSLLLQTRFRHVCTYTSMKHVWKRVTQHCQHLLFQIEQFNNTKLSNDGTPFH